MATKRRRYTIRNVPRRVDEALRRKAAERGVSLNTLMLSALEAAAGEPANAKVYDDLEDLFGTWVHDPGVDRALAEQRRVDPDDRP